MWGIARFSDPAARERVEALGGDHPRRSTSPRATSATCRPTSPTCCTSLPTSAPTTTTAPCGSTPRAPGSLLEHCRTAKAALVMSTVTVYKPHPDPWHAFTRGRPAGRRHGAAVRRRTRSRRSPRRRVARYCARSFDLPITIARMGAAYGEQGGLPALAPRRRSPPASRCRPAGIRCPTARSTTTTSRPAGAAARRRDASRRRS